MHHPEYPVGNPLQLPIADSHALDLAAGHLGVLRVVAGDLVEQVKDLQDIGPVVVLAFQELRLQVLWELVGLSQQAVELGVGQGVREGQD